VYLSITDSFGNTIPCKQIFQTGLPRTEDFVLLKPGEETTSDRKRNLRAYFNLRRLGKYTIVAYYQNVHGRELGINAFRGKLVSAPISIEITEDK
jgi:hypothetical protein